MLLEAEALERYHNDKERKEEEKMRQSAIEKRETERKKREKEERKRRAKEEQEEYIRAQEREIERQIQENIRREQMRQRQQEREDSYRRQQYQQQYQQYQQYEQPNYQEQQRAHSHEGYARAGPAQEPQLSPRSRLSRRHPSPKTKQDALTILQFDPRANPTEREIKTAFNKMAMRLHPDKNLDNPDEASVLFKQVHSAYKLLKPQAGGIIRRNKRKSKRKINKSRKYKTTKRHFSKRRK